MRIYLVRHGESEGNVDKDVHRQVADHAIPLSEKGQEQAYKAGQFLARHIVAHDSIVPFDTADLRHGRHTFSGKLPFRLWTSPYRRTRETSQGILKAIKDSTGAEPENGVREHIMLAEQQFGLFDGLSDDELARRYPDEFTHYKKCEKFEGRFWSRLPLGESRFDVAVRVHQAFGTFHRDAEEHGIRNLVVVAHGTTIRAFIMQWFHHTPEWFEREKNPENGSIRLIEDKEDHGYIFKPQCVSSDTPSEG